MRTNKLLILMAMLPIYAIVICNVIMLHNLSEAVTNVQLLCHHESDADVIETVIESPETGPEETEEDPYEEMHTKMAVIATIGTDQEKEAFGYDFSYVCRVVMSEAGSDSDELQTAVATCIYNACKRENWKYSPEEICTLYRYDEPAVYASDRVIQNTLDVLYLGNVNETVEDAVYFYNPHIYGRSAWHDSMTYVCTIDEQVEFFK